MACSKHNNWNFRNDMHPPLSLWDCDPQGKTRILIIILMSILLAFPDMFSALLVSSAKHRHYEKTVKSSSKCFIYGKLLRHTNKVSLRFLLHDTLHEAFFTGYQEGNIIDNHS